MIDTDFATCTNSEEGVEIEMKTVADPESGFLTAEERIQRKILKTLTNVSKERDTHVGQLYLVKFVKNVEGEATIVIHAAQAVFKGWEFVGWSVKGCMKNPQFYIQENLKPDPKIVKILRRRMQDTPYNVSRLKHYLKGFCVQQIRKSVPSKYVSLLYQTVRLAKNRL